MVSPILELKNINKSFGHVQANKNINLKITQGTIHGIIGENGAGKSTLMSIVYGLYQADSGTISVSGKEIKLKSPRDSIESGIGMPIPLSIESLGDLSFISLPLTLIVPESAWYKP